MPESIVLLATPDGWRHSIHTADGGLLCGRLDGVPADGEPEAAQTAVAALLGDLAGGTAVEVTWDPSPDSASWTGRVRPAR
ncbi:hypothetical protein [Streptomyces diastatochromogenes]|uniref:DUF2188 domain-containing protein n=1 Tax=Streptomyces diastatochromogenes TaxID=42236 RepID=A0A233RZE0_STRDA|nr:hypothetical protein [Streptomyces diastatochromogenes]OXY88765.1 hypothetical protein BEK98_41790 [Streptomyces diastatochromogenes]